MLRSLQKNSKENKAQKSNIFQVFICSCRQQYQSFPALYLHNKMKHGISLTISEKQKMEKKIVWSGKKKKIIYEFDQQYASSQENEEHTFKAKHSQLKNNNSGKTQSIEERETKAELEDFIVTRKWQNPQEGLRWNQNQHVILQKFFDFFKNLNSINLATSNSAENVNSACISNIPLAFNEFIVDHLPKSFFRNHREEQVLKVLQKFSTWLYQNKLTPYLAILNS